MKIIMDDVVYDLDDDRHADHLWANLKFLFTVNPKLSAVIKVFNDDNK